MNRLLAGLAALAVACAASPAWADPPQAWDHVARVVVFGDLHGDYGKFHDQLAQAHLIDAKDNWSGGKTHFVQVGDVPDRAPDTRKILDLLMKLEPQARRAGGYVHALIGNHEAMNMEGDLRYTTPGEFAAFADAHSAERRDRYYAAVVAALTKSPPPEGLPKFDADYRAKFDQEHPLGWVEHMLAWSPQGVYGRWVLTHSAVIRIDDTLYLHGGLGPSYQAYDAATMNRAVVAALSHAPATANDPPDILWNEEGPLWYRGLAMHDEASEQANVAALLAKHHVSRIVIGHTKVYPFVEPRFGGEVILVDIAPPAGCAEPHAFLVKQGETLDAVHRGRELPLGTSGEALQSYHAQITALDQAAGCAMRPPSTAADRDAPRS